MRRRVAINTIHPAQWAGAFAVVYLLAPMVCGAQEHAGTAVQFDNVRLRSDPSFMLLGISPEKVDRPTEVTDLAISLRTTSDDFAALPQSYALAFAPYWLTPKPRQRFADWAAASGFGAPFFRAMTLSAAAHTVDNGDASLTSIATGIRTSLWRGAVDDTYRENVAADLQVLRAKAREIHQKLRAHHTATVSQAIVDIYEAAEGQPSPQVFEKLKLAMPVTSDIDSLLEAAWLEFAGALAAERPGSEDALDRLYELASERQLAESLSAIEVNALLEQLAQSDAMRVKGLVPNRVGFQVDIAGAIAWDYLNSVAESGQLSSGSGWLNFAYLRPQMTAVLVTKATGTKGAPSVYDLGGRLTYDASTKVSPSIEGVVRWENQRRPDYSVSLILESTLGRSNSLVFAFGRDFQPELAKSLIVTLQFITATGFDTWFGDK